MKILRKILVLFMMFVFLFIIINLIKNLKNEKDYLFLIPIIIMSLIVVLLLLCFINECIGFNDYSLEDNVIIIKNKKETIKIKNEDIKNLIIVRDFDSKKIWWMKFKYLGKKYFIEIKNNDSNLIELFVKDIEYKEKDNFLISFIAFILQIFN